MLHACVDICTYTCMLKYIYCNIIRYITLNKLMVCPSPLHALLFSLFPYADDLLLKLLDAHLQVSVPVKLS